MKYLMKFEKLITKEIYFNEINNPEYFTLFEVKTFYTVYNKYKSKIVDDYNKFRVLSNIGSLSQNFYIYNTDDIDDINNIKSIKFVICKSQRYSRIEYLISIFKKDDYFYIYSNNHGRKNIVETEYFSKYYKCDQLKDALLCIESFVI
jgi:hypothetical protein